MAKSGATELKYRRIYLPQELDKEFKADAKNSGRSVVKQIEVLIATYLELRKAGLKDISELSSVARKSQPHIKVQAPRKCQNCDNKTDLPICPKCSYPVADAKYLAKVDLNTLPYGVIRLAADGAILAFNKAERELSRVHDKQMIGVNFFEFAPCGGVKRLRERFKKFLNSGGKPEQFDTTYNFKFGSVRVTLTFFKESEGIGYVISTKSTEQNEHGVA